MELLASSFNLAQPWLLKACGKYSDRWKIFSLPAFQAKINAQLKIPRSNKVENYSKNWESWQSAAWGEIPRELSRIIGYQK